MTRRIVRSWAAAVSIAVALGTLWCIWAALPASTHLRLFASPDSQGTFRDFGIQNSSGDSETCIVDQSGGHTAADAPRLPVSTVVQGPCRDVPFLLRPLFGPPDHIKVNFGHVGYFLWSSCATGRPENPLPGTAQQ